MRVGLSARLTGFACLSPALTTKDRIGHGHCRRSSQRQPFLRVAGAETTADIGALIDRLRRALSEAEVLGLHDIRGHLDEALRLAVRHAMKDKVIAGESPEAHTIGQHESVA